MQKGFLSPEEYKQVYRAAPIFCVDLVAVCDNEFLLGKRTNEPERGKWFLPGGRVFKMESLENAVARKAKEELGIRVTRKDVSFLMLGTVMSNTAAFSKDQFHAIIGVYKIAIKKKELVKPDAQHSELKWFSRIQSNWHPYVKEALRTVGFR